MYPKKELKKHGGTNWWMIGTIGLVVLIFFGLVGLAALDGERFGPPLLVIVTIILVIAGFLLYFLPMIIAMVRHHRQIVPIILLNIFVGWTFIGWVAALIWASAAFKRD